MTSWPADQLQSIHRMLDPVSIAVVGATPRLQYGGRFLRAALQAGDRVRIYPVNPRYDEIMGLKSYPSLADVPESPDVVGDVVPYHQSHADPGQSPDRVGAASTPNLWGCGRR